jgi:tetratricopeptide (TPR) repeat protein
LRQSSGISRTNPTRSVSTDHLDRMLEQAGSYLEDGKPLHAMQLYHRILRDDPRRSLTYVRLAALYCEMELHGQAERLLREGVRSTPRNPELFLSLADVLLSQGRYTQAAHWYGRARIPGQVRTHYCLALCYLRTGRAAAAERELRQALSIRPALPAALELLAEIMILRRQYGPAIEQLREALKRNPYSGSGHRLLGMALLGMRQSAEALEELHLAVDINPEDASAWSLCGDTLIRLRRFGEAEYYLARALALDPGSADAATSLGYLHLRTGHPKEALRAFETALRIQPGHTRALDGKLHIRLLSQRS